ncbi:hypothetical protein NDU88_005500 [Pleurodeles waltl]|uniref:Uncharacterized protein n=1 Tax=Pleurodeles waltl TaxID=8319 RepID=A0AAV7LXH7_PLEWA|nr:hypothetical protein NDU88_005500 [Pleurodeles waltl]
MGKPSRGRLLVGRRGGLTCEWSPPQFGFAQATSDHGTNRHQGRSVRGSSAAGASVCLATDPQFTGALTGVRRVRTRQEWLYKQHTRYPAISSFPLTSVHQEKDFHPEMYADYQQGDCLRQTCMTDSQSQSHAQ